MDVRKEMGKVEESWDAVGGDWNLQGCNEGKGGYFEFLWQRKLRWKAVGI